MADGGSPRVISAGGVVNVTGGIGIGGDLFYGLGPSTVTVTGAGSALNTDSLQVGQLLVRRLLRHVHVRSLLNLGRGLSDAHGLVIACGGC